MGLQPLSKDMEVNQYLHPRQKLKDQLLVLRQPPELFVERVIGVTVLVPDMWIFYLRAFPGESHHT